MAGLNEDDKTKVAEEKKAAEENKAAEVSKAEEIKIDNNDFAVIEEEGQEKFQCDNCDFKTDKVISIKRRITAKHVMKTPGRKRKSMESAKVETNTKQYSSMSRSQSKCVPNAFSLTLDHHACHFAHV